MFPKKKEKKKISNFLSVLSRRCQRYRLFNRHYHLSRINDLVSKPNPRFSDKIKLHVKEMKETSLHLNFLFLASRLECEDHTFNTLNVDLGYVHLVQKVAIIAPFSIYQIQTEITKDQTTRNQLKSLNNSPLVLVFFLFSFHFFFLFYLLSLLLFFVFTYTFFFSFFIFLFRISN